MDGLEITCTACRHRQQLALACERCDKNVSPLRRNISNEARARLSSMIADEAAMLKRLARGGGTAIANWIGASSARRKRARTVFNYPKGWQFRRGKSSGRASPVHPIELPPLEKSQ